MSAIDVKEVISDNNSDYNIKRFKLSNLDINNHVKTYDSNFLTQQILHTGINTIKDIPSPIIIETSKEYRIPSINYLLEETDSQNIRRKFGFREWFSDLPNFITPRFSFNPFTEFGDVEKLSGFYDYYYSHSDTALFIPNINVEKNIYEEMPNGNLKKIGVERIIKPDEFKKFVKESYEILSFKNNKPIFVPLPLKYDMNTITDLANFFLDNDYFNIWFDYQSSPVTHRPKLSLIRNFSRIYKEKERYEEAIFHVTNIRREIISNIKDNLSPSSDILSPIIGQNLIGINQSPRMIIRGEKPKLSYKEQQDIRSHKARIFQPDSYFYQKVDSMDISEEFKQRLRERKNNTFENAILLNKELLAQYETFIGEQTIRDYIENKDMIRTFKEGQLSNVLFSRKQSFIDQWF